MMQKFSIEIYENPEYNFGLPNNLEMVERIKTGNIGGKREKKAKKKRKRKRKRKHKTKESKRRRKTKKSNKRRRRRKTRK